MTNSIYQTPKAYVYIGYHLITDKIYVGARWANVKQNRPASEDFGIHYFTSSKYVKPIFNEFEWEIVFEGTDDEVKDLEDEMILMYLKSGILFNHHASKTFNNIGRTFSEEHIAKLREANLGEKNPMFMKGHLISGNKHPFFNKHLSEEHVAKLKAAMKDKNVGENNPMFGVESPFKNRTHSEEAKAKNRESQLTVPKKTCPHCNRDFRPGNYANHHGDNCKFKVDK